MRKLDKIALHKEAVRHRNELVELDGELIPKSAAIFMSVLASEADSIVRFGLYLEAISECTMAGRTAAAVKFAHAQYQELRDIASLKGYSEALTENGEFEAGVARAKEALALAIEEQTCVNYAAENLVRQAIKTGSAQAVNEALEALADSTQVPRKGDCVFDMDWKEEAVAVGADQELISRVWAIVGRRQIIDPTKISPDAPKRGC